MFVHYSSIENSGYKSLKEGDTVEFEVEKGLGGKEQAANVRRTDGEA